MTSSGWWLSNLMASMLQDVKQYAERVHTKKKKQKKKKKKKKKKKNGIECIASLPEVIEFRDCWVAELGERLVVASVQASINAGRVPDPGPTGSRNRLQSTTLLDAIAEHQFDCLIGGARRDEDKARAKERGPVLPCETFGQWVLANQRPEPLAPVQRSRPHRRARARLPDLRLDRARRVALHRRRSGGAAGAVLLGISAWWWSGRGRWSPPARGRRPVLDEDPFETVRYRTVGDMTCTCAVRSEAASAEEIVAETAASRVTERRHPGRRPVLRDGHAGDRKAGGVISNQCRTSYVSPRRSRRRRQEHADRPPAPRHQGPPSTTNSTPSSLSTAKRGGEGLDNSSPSSPTASVPSGNRASPSTLPTATSPRSTRSFIIADACRLRPLHPQHGDGGVDGRRGRHPGQAPAPAWSSRPGATPVTGPSASATSCSPSTRWISSTGPSRSSTTWPSSSPSWPTPSYPVAGTDPDLGVEGRQRGRSVDRDGLVQRAHAVEHLETVELARPRWASPAAACPCSGSSVMTGSGATPGRSWPGCSSRATTSVVLPAGKRSRILSIDTHDGPLEVAAPWSSVSVTLADDLDVGRGDLIATEPAPYVTRDGRRPCAGSPSGRWWPGTGCWCSTRPGGPGSGAGAGGPAGRDRPVGPTGTGGAGATTSAPCAS